ncbi:hypothetical protein LOCC1_G005864 [Lachnellula occidentalis]|uniref:2EXR domain-containing protein n=1 Tax=Lachnellula occidentalis TaxID=215460 RepID=A0A8H8RZN8_9HELO|nr:hypothetical protein LOCC1_G005864 [Lachnellula occidentalis]
MNENKMTKICKACKMHKKKSSVAKEPHNPSFLRFPKLPTELRAIIWKLTLQARTVEIEWQETRGFYTQVGTPVALQVCKDSRDAVISFYPACFGNLMFTPRTAFNFSLDTLYIGIPVHDQILHLVASLNATEISKLQHLAIDHGINMDWRWEYDGEIDYEACVKKAASLMPNLRVFLEVVNLAAWLEDGIDEGEGAMNLYLDWPDKVEDMHICPMSRVRCSCGEYHSLGQSEEDSDGFEYYDDEDDEVETCDQHDLPDENSMEPLPSRPDGRPTPKISVIWGWRPTK